MGLCWLLCQLWKSTLNNRPIGCYCKLCHSVWGFGALCEKVPLEMQLPRYNTFLGSHSQLLAPKVRLIEFQSLFQCNKDNLLLMCSAWRFHPIKWVCLGSRFQDRDRGQRRINCTSQITVVAISTHGAQRFCEVADDITLMNGMCRKSWLVMQWCNEIAWLKCSYNVCHNDSYRVKFSSP